MTCDPSEHNFVKTSQYEITKENKDAVVQKCNEVKKCTKCGKTPDELKDFVTDSDTSDAPVTTESTEDESNPDDAMIISTDNSETQEGTNKQSNTTTEPTTQKKHQDDAVILGSSSSEVIENTDPEVDESLEGQWDGEEPDSDTTVLECSSCGFSKAQQNVPQYPGDSCPNCQTDYLQTR